MAFSVSMRMKNPGPAKYLIEKVEEDTFVDALRTANHMTDRTPPDHFVEITNEVGEVLAKFNGYR